MDRGPREEQEREQPRGEMEPRVRKRNRRWGKQPGVKPHQTEDDMSKPVDELYDGSGDMYYIAQALVRKIASDGGESLPKSGGGIYYRDRFEEIVFRAIVEMIESNSGVGFHNCDQGHPAYRMGANDRIGMGDGPRENGLFQLLQKFDQKYHEGARDLSTWDSFCKLAVEE